MDFAWSLSKAEAVDHRVAQVSSGWAYSTGRASPAPASWPGTAGHLPAFLFLPASYPREEATASTSRGRVGSPQGSRSEELPQNSGGDRFGGQREQAGRPRAGVSSPEPRISSHSTTGARGGSAALIGPAARRRPVSGATGPGAAAGGGGGGRAGGAGRERPCSPARPGSGRRTQRGELASASPRSDSGAGARGADSAEARAHLRLYRAGGDSGIVRAVTSRPRRGWRRPPPQKRLLPQNHTRMEAPRLPRA